MTDPMKDRGMSRREFLSRSAVVTGGLALASCTGRSHVPVIRPTMAGKQVAGVDTRWPIKRVVYLMLENRSFNGIFGRHPLAESGTTTGVKFGKEIPLTHCPDWLPGDLPHDRWSALLSLNDGAMDGFAIGQFGDLYAYSQFDRADVPNYWHWAEEFVMCENFYASMMGPSYPNHLFMVAGTGGGAIDNPEGIKVRRDGPRNFKSWGCDAYGDDVYVLVQDDVGNVAKHDTCFTFRTVGEQLSEQDIDWAYYSADPHQSGYFWNAYTAIEQVFHSELWDEHVWPVDHLVADIEAESLPSVTWITPRFQLSDHPPFSTVFSHNWVTRVVNAIMESSMWEHTAIFITWDEWGGMYDPVAPPKLDGHWLGFRVPMLVISPYARRGYVDRLQDPLGDFVSPIRFVADNWGLPYLTRRYEQVHNFEHVFDFARKPRPPDPQPRNPNTFGTWKDFPDHFPEWPKGIEAQEPDTLS
jgi:phospholipase C